MARMNTALFIKMLIGALMVLAIQLLATSRHYYLAALAPLFPAFMVFSHYLIGSARTSADLRSAALFGMFAVIPYFLYILTVFLSANRLPLAVSIALGLTVWCTAALLLILCWQRWIP